MNAHQDRISHFKGTAREIGLSVGRRFAGNLEYTIDHYISSLADSTDFEKLRVGAMPWLRSLPERFQEEYEGISEGADIPLQHLVEWTFIEECERRQCSGAVWMVENKAWVARNNDAYVPELWGYVTIREVQGRIPAIHFSMEGDVFTPTGINKERLWLHYNFLDVWDKPAPGKPHMPGYVFLTNALELCRTIADVESYLEAVDRDGGMLLFAVDGKNNEFALFDCMCSKHYRRQLSGDWLVGTNHYCACEDLTLGDDEGSVSTLKRFNRMEALLKGLSVPQASIDLPGDLVRILADDEVERRGKKLVTVYSNVACPATGEIWYTFGGYPAASQGNWQRLEWPWRDGSTSS